MAFTTIKEPKAEKTVSLREVGQKVEGFYLGHKTIAGKYGDSKLHLFETQDGSMLGVWGSGRLDYGLNLLAPKNSVAVMVRVTHKGTVPSKKGNEAHDFKFEVDRTKTTEALILNSDELPAQEYSEKPASFSSSNNSVSYDDSEESVEVVLPPSRVTPNPVRNASAESAKQVAEILERRKGR